MTPEPVYEQLHRTGVLPVLTVAEVAEAAPLAAALAEGGLTAAEVTFRTPNAAGVLAVLAQTPGLLAGAGTVVRPEQVKAAVAAGARFVVSPGWSEAVFRACGEHQVSFLPGAATASEVQRAAEHGIEVVKFFPARALGGPATIAALAAPFPGVRFVPTGGITEQTAPRYLSHPAVLAVGGSWMAPPALLSAGNWTEITRLSAAAATVAAVRGAS